MQVPNLLGCAAPRERAGPVEARVLEPLGECCVIENASYCGGQAG